MNGKAKFAAALRVLAAPAVLVLAALVLALAVGNLSDGSTAEGRDRLEDAVRRGAVTCYASEGIYPPTLEYLEEHYGVQVDESRYTVFYDAFAENLMPDITVVENEGA
ncbi:hypothetical protein OBV_10150 [Oscillibacter valericigenes Sjm18-20]|nr:hypothetical protein OBV_10150 [Oscillibacter valericigenes Sjm18-20]